MIKMIKGTRIIILAAFILLVSCIGVTVVFADTDSTASATVYVTISNDSVFVRGRNGTVMAHVPFTVEYFDLAEYGLDQYYRYDDDDKLIEQPTVLHLLIRVLERYYAMRTLNREGDMHSNIIDVTGAPKSLWLDRFWGHDGNLMYFVNHEYPLMGARWGATADYIILSDGDDVDLAMYTDWGFYNNSAFLYFDQSMPTAKVGQPLELQLLAAPTSVVNDGIDRGSIPMKNEGVRISSNYGVTWNQAEEKTDEDGLISLTFDSAGTYYVATGPSHTNYTDAAPAISVVTVREPTPEEQAIYDAKQTAINDLRSYKPSDLYREAEQTNLASIIKSGTASIKAAATLSAVQTAYNNAISQIDALKTKAQYEAEERAQQEAEEAARRALQEAKDNAKASLSVYKDLAYYRTAEQIQISQIVEAGRAAIDAAETQYAVESVLAEYKGRLDEIKTDAELTREEQETALQSAITLACAELDAYVDPALYRDNEKQIIADIIIVGKANIQQAESLAGVADALAAAKALLDDVKTDAEYAAEEHGQSGDDDPETKTLAEAKTDAKAELAEYLESKDLTLYRDEQKTELTQAAEQGNVAIDAAKSIDEVTAALADAKAALDAVRTDAQMAEEEKALVKTKDNALTELYLYKVPADYREAEKVLMEDILEEGDAAINAAKTADEVAALLAEYKEKLDQLKTDEQYTKEEQEAERKAKAAAIKKAKAAKTTVKVKALTKHKAKVTWKKVSGVTGYKVYRATKKAGKYKLVKTMKKAKTVKYINRKLKKGKKYFYKVRTYTRIDGKNYLGKWSKVRSIRAK